MTTSYAFKQTIDACSYQLVERPRDGSEGGIVELSNIANYALFHLSV